MNNYNYKDFFVDLHGFLQRTLQGIDFNNENVVTLIRYEKQFGLPAYTFATYYQFKLFVTKPQNYDKSFIMRYYHTERKVIDNLIIMMKGEGNKGED